MGRQKKHARSKRISKGHLRVVSELRDGARRCAGFGLFWTWVWSVFQSTALVQPQFSVIAPLPAWTMPLLFYAVGFAVLGVLYRSKRIVPHGRAYRVVVPLSMTGGAFLAIALAQLSWETPWYDAACVASCALMGCATSCMHTEWARLFAGTGAHQTIVCGVFATLMAALLSGLLGLAASIASKVMVALLPVTAAWLLWTDPLETDRFYLLGRGAHVYVPWKLVITAGIQGVSLGAMETMAHHVLGDASTLLAIAGFVAGSILALALIMYRQVTYNALLYQIGFPLLAAGWLFFLVGARCLPVAAGLHAVGYRFVDLAIWSLTIYLIRQRELPTNLVTAMNTCALIGGQFAGSMLALAFVRDSRVIAPSGNVLAALIVFALFMTAICIYSSKNLRDGWGLFRPDEEGEPDRFGVACQEIGREAGLTKRETQIFMLLAKGRSKSYICSELVLADNTVKSYIKTVYRKLGIHSQQELISQVERHLEELTEMDAE